MLACTFIEPSKATNYRAISFGTSPSDTHTCTRSPPTWESAKEQRRLVSSHELADTTNEDSIHPLWVNNLVAVSENKRRRLVAVVDSDGYVKVVPRWALVHGLVSSQPSILRLPAGHNAPVSIQWGPSHHGLSLCIVVACAGIIIIRCQSEGNLPEGQFNAAPHPHLWYEDRLSTVDCDGIDFESGQLSIPSASGCVCAPTCNGMCATSPPRGLSPNIYGGRSSFTVVSALFSPYGNDLLVFFEGRHGRRNAEGAAQIATTATMGNRGWEGCRAVLFRRGGNVKGAHPNTWVSIKKTSRLLRQMMCDANHEGGIDGEEVGIPRPKHRTAASANPPAIAKSVGSSVTVNPRRRRRADHGQSEQAAAVSSPPAVSFCAAAWHPQFYISSVNHTYDISVKQVSSLTTLCGDAADSNANGELSGSCDSEGTGCGDTEDDNAPDTDYSAIVHASQIHSDHPLSIVAVAGTDGAIRVVDMAQHTSGFGGELLVIDVSTYAFRGNCGRRGERPKILSLDWGHRVGNISVLFVTTMENLLALYLTFNSATVTITTTPGKKKASPIVRRRPHAIVWAMIADVSVHPIRSISSAEAPALPKAYVLANKASWPPVGGTSAPPLPSSALPSSSHTRTSGVATDEDEYTNNAFADPSASRDHANRVSQILSDQSKYHSMLTFGVSPASYAGSSATTSALRPSTPADGGGVPSTRLRRQQVTLLPTQHHAYDSNPLTRSAIRSDVAVAVSGAPPAISSNLPIGIGLDGDQAMVFVPTGDGIVKFVAHPPRLQNGVGHQWFPQPPAVVRLNEWNDFVRGHTSDDGLLHLTFVRARCQGNPSAVIVGGKDRITLSAQQIKETHRTLARIQEMTNNGSEKGSVQTLTDKIFGFVVKTCRRITRSEREVTSVQHSSLPIDTHRIVKLDEDFTVSVTTHESFQTATVVTTSQRNLRPRNDQPSVLAIVSIRNQRNDFLFTIGQ